MEPAPDIQKTLFQFPEKMVPVVRGGVNPASVQGIAKAILPVPGGLMTIVLAILFRNAVNAFEHSLKLQGVLPMI